MAHDNSTSRRRRFPIAVEVYNVFTKGYGVLPLNFASEFSSQLGRKPTISNENGKIYHIRFEKTSNGGLLTTGWCLFVEECNLISKSKVILQYVGESFFLIKSSDLEEKSNDYDSDMENSSIFSETPTLMYEIIINLYCATTHQLLPVDFVQSCLNVNLKSITLIVNDGRKWECGLYVCKTKPSKAAITTGWNNFCSDLQLKGKNRIFFEVLDGQQNLFRVVLA